MMDGEHTLDDKVFLQSLIIRFTSHINFGGTRSEKCQSFILLFPNTLSSVSELKSSSNYLTRLIVCLIEGEQYVSCVTALTTRKKSTVCKAGIHVKYRPRAVWVVNRD